MPDPTPPFSALRALEAATRHRSFTWAAQELHVSHSAISQAIRRLEAEVGTRLFERRGGAMQPSEAALKLAQSYSAAAQQLTELLHEISGRDDARKVSVRMPHDWAMLWAPSRLGRLAEVMPDMEVTISAEARDGTEDVELLGTRKPRPTDDVLCQLSAQPICSPVWAEARDLATPADIGAQTLLDDPSGTWSVWLDRHLPGARPDLKVFADAASILDAAARGEGLALADLSLAQGRLDDGELIALPFPVETGVKLVFRARTGRSKSASLERLAMWLRLELARDAGQRRRPPRT